jgi:hypothetical protein
LLEVEMGKRYLLTASMGSTELRMARETVARMVAVQVSGMTSYWKL